MGYGWKGTSGRAFFWLGAALLVLLVLLEFPRVVFLGWLGWSWFIRALPDCSATGQFPERVLAVVCLSAGLELARFQARLFG
jgi:hypothetical protein